LINQNDLIKLKNKFLFNSDWHIHTNYVHGKNSILQCAQKAKDNNLQLIVIIEHVRKKLTYNFSDFLKDIEVAKGISGIQILSGVEAKVIDIRGNLDLPSMVIDKVDLIYGVFHSWFKDTIPIKKEYLKALFNLIEKRRINLWGHPFLIPEKYNIHFRKDEILKIIQFIKENELFIEINLRHQLPPSNFLNIILEQSVPFVISSDAHNCMEIWNKEKPIFINSQIWQKMKKGRWTNE